MTAIAILHPTTLLGKELRQTIERRAEPGWSDLRLLSPAEEEVGSLTELFGAAAMVAKADAVAVADVGLALVCGSLDESRPLLDALPAGATVVLLSPDAGTADGTAVVAGVTPDTPAGQVLVSPHPGALLLCHLLHPLRGLGLRRASALLVQPVSMFQEAGLDALLEDTRRILAMRGGAPPELFGHQLAFNLMPGPPDGHRLAALAAAALAAGGDRPEISAHLLQGSVFHGFSAAVHVAFDAAPAPEEVREALGDHPANRLAEEPEHLGPIAVAGEEGVLVGAVEPDGAGGCWLWAVMDNLAAGAANAVAVADQALGHR